MSDIDDALKANADSVTELANRSRFTKLKEIAVPANTWTVLIPLDDVDWSAWDKVHIDGITINTDPVDIHYNTSENNSPQLSLGGTQGTIHRPRMTFLVGNDPQRRISVLWGSDSDQCALTFAELEKLILDDGVLQAGTKFILWGER